MNDPDQTHAHSPDDPKSSVVDHAAPELPKSIGRYRVERILGQGGFGLVYLAHDDQLKRLVAIKVPHARLVAKASQAEAYLTEARTVANLDHSNIVPVYDVGSTDQFPCFIVSKYIDGIDLATKLTQDRLTIHATVELMATVAEALNHAHQQSLVHRDIKPANILLDKRGHPFVTDFGLALREQDIGKGPRFAGTPTYMSPEQARGEGHRVDGRSDIFSLGVVLYEMLTGRRPFKADSQLELFDQIASFDPRPPRQCDDMIPKELDRICLKALSKRASERYSAAKDMADDLRCFLAQSPSPSQFPSPAPITPTGTGYLGNATPIATPFPSPTTTPGSDSQPIKIVPKGLRSFDAHDADFFLELLPGARDRDGLPESIRFWKNCIEETDADNTFSVGLIYGPSGCGKSSLVKAGLLPHLSNTVIAVYVEATAAETETRLLNGLRKRCAALPNNLTLKETLAALRRGQGIPLEKKVVIILDQFEQWLHAKKDEKDTELVQALRQCDGSHVQCIVMVRDDFWMAVTRFLSELEVALVQHQNFAPVDLFPIRHAEKVLTAFGRAFGVLPDKFDDATMEQKSFITQSVADLAEEGKVICVRLALFAEMMKGKPWTPASLKEVGGTKGVGVTFLEETFSARVNPKHKLHEKAARAVLKALLPDSGTDIKGHMRSNRELLEASGYESRPKDFADLIRILDSEIRLITPTDPEGLVENTNVECPLLAVANVGQECPTYVSTEPFALAKNSIDKFKSQIKYYQLTHDYLVPSLRDWLTRKQRETRRGRAELKLAERASAWNTKRETKQLPTTSEWLGISLLTDHKRWTNSQRSMMQKANKLHLTNWGSALSFLLLVSITTQQLFAAQRWASLKAQTLTAVDAAQNNLGANVKYAIRDLQKLPRELVKPELEGRFEAETDPQRKLGLAFALARYEHVKADHLVAQIDAISEVDTSNFITALDLDREQSITALGKAASVCDKPLWRRKAKLATVALYLGSSEIAEDICAIENRREPEQRTLFVDEFPIWNGDLQRVLNIASTVDSTSLQSAICLVAGQIPISRLTKEEKQSFETIATKCYRDKSDTTTHSASGWLLQKWGISPPEISEANKIVPDREWFVNSVGMTMLQMMPGSFHQLAESNDERKDRDVEIKDPFWLADREITVGQFQQFIDDTSCASKEKPSKWVGDDPRHTSRYAPTPNRPAVSVDWYDAILFCNWLSLREGREPCYVRTGEKDKGSDGKPTEDDAWRLIPRSTGYRLPTSVEWEYACRAGTTTNFSCGNDETQLVAYARFLSSSSSTCGDKLPNGWGLFDMHGNVWEWCEDSIRSARVLRGGSWHDGAESYRAAAGRLAILPTTRSYLNGFRLALSPSVQLPESEKEKN